MTIGKPMKRAVMCLLFFACLSGAIGITVAASPSGAAAQTGGEREAIRSGGQLERSEKWREAIELYEKSLKSWPESQQLKYGLRRSKIHFGIERRYSDGSFETSLLRKSRNEALTLFDEVLHQVKSNYIKPISSTSFVAHGTESLYLALANKKFLKLHLRQTDPRKIERMRGILRDQFWNKLISQHTAAYQTVDQVCNYASSVLGLPGSAVVMEYIFGGCNALDDYSNYLTPDRWDDLYGNIEGEFVGLGIEMKSESGKGLLLVNVLPQSPAAEGGMLRGEHIVSINGSDCRHMTTDEAARMLRGPVGSRVRLELRSPTKSQEREGIFVRRSVLVKSIPIVRMVDQAQGIGYLKMTGFQKTTPAELDAALSRLRRQGMRALIWDLRGNPGGLLQAAVEVVDRFIEEGVLVSTRGRMGDQNWNYSAHRPGTTNLPLVLLVDGDSASASEIVAGAVADLKRGLIVGRQTYGKWSVQSLVRIHGAPGLRLTTAKFYSPRGRTLSKIGIRPDVIVQKSKSQVTFFRGPADDLNLDGDDDLQMGLKILRKQISRR